MLLQGTSTEEIQVFIHYDYMIQTFKVSLRYIFLYLYMYSFIFIDLHTTYMGPKNEKIILHIIS